jgi:inosine-uridine nucleoside N-ribohydrolase
MMGGNFDEAGTEAQRIEWNVAGDLLASEVAYGTAVRLHRSLGLNVTQQVMMSADEAREKFSAPLMHPVLDMAEIWFAQFYPSITFHDPLAAAAVFRNDLCTYQQGMVKLDHTDEPGKTIWQPGQADAPHQVAMTVDVDRYFQHFFGVIG